jgi:hypothetical protein
LSDKQKADLLLLQEKEKLRQEKAKNKLQDNWFISGRKTGKYNGKYVVKI